MPTTKKPSILLVDDDPAMLRLLAKWLEAEGYVVHRANHGKEAVEAITAECPDILVTDWEMPVMDGLELCRWVRQTELPHYVYTIFLTVRSGSDDMVRGLESGADDFLRKPVDRSELLARIRSGTRVLELESRLSLLAKRDPLTGLATQRTFYEHTTTEWARSARHHFNLSCVMVDIDFFKRINDEHGHGVGDEVIRRLAKVLKDNSRSSDVVSRYGGEEFCVLLPETSESAATLWAERVRQSILTERIRVGKKELSISASLGVAERLPDTASPAALVELADQALLVAKRSGRDRVVSYRSLNQASGEEIPYDNRARLFGGVKARSVMTTIVAGLKQNDSISHATRYFLRFRIGSAPVVNDAGQLVGILSDKDCLATMLTPGWGEMLIGEAMKHNVVCYDEETPVQSIYEFLCRVSIRSVVILSSGCPVGVITRGSLLRWASNVLSSDALSKESEQLKMTRAETAWETPQARIIRTAQAVMHEGSLLERSMEHSVPDLVPCVIGAASKMQELVNDLLACARYANEGLANYPDNTDTMLFDAHSGDTQHGSANEQTQAWGSLNASN